MYTINSFNFLIYRYNFSLIHFSSIIAVEFEIYIWSLYISLLKLKYFNYRELQENDI